MRSVFLICMSFCVAACSSHNNDLTTDLGTMQEGDRLLKEEFYEDARKQYTRIKTEFPESNLQVEADLKIAETYYQDESYVAAASAFQDFVKTYPGRPETPEALYKLGMCHINQLPSNSQRDTRPASKAIDAFTRLLVDYPGSKYSEDAQKNIDTSRKILAEKIFNIARFYQRQGKYLSCAKRYAELQDQYPDLPIAEEAMAREVSCRAKLGETEKAEELRGSFNARYPESKFKDLAQ